MNKRTDAESLQFAGRHSTKRDRNAQSLCLAFGYMNCPGIQSFHDFEFLTPHFRQI